MKRRYIRCRAGLLIGLLSVHTLSSCASTRQTLGIETFQQQETSLSYEEQREKMGFGKNTGKPQASSYCGSPLKWNILLCLMGTIASITVSTAVSYWILMPSMSNLKEAPMENDTKDLVTVGPGAMHNTTNVQTLAANSIYLPGNATLEALNPNLTRPISNISAEEESRIIKAIHTPSWPISGVTSRPKV